MGVLLGEGHFGGDGKVAHVTLRMHTDHENLFRWLETKCPWGRLYGPYDHSGRRYFQWMVRGSALRDHLVPILDRRLDSTLSSKVHERYLDMKHRYRL